MTTTRDRLEQGRFGHATVGAPPPYVDPGEVPATEARPRRTPPRGVTVALVVLALLAVALLGGRAWGRHGQVQVWRITADLAAGARLDGRHLQAVGVSREAAVGAVPADTPVAGAVLTRALPAGALLSAQAVARSGAVPGPGQALVGVAAAAGLAPQGLRPGDRVRVLRLPAQQNGAPGAARGAAHALLDAATVSDVTSGGASGMVVTLVVPEGDAVEVAGLAAADRIALVGLPR